MRRLSAVLLLSCCFGTARAAPNFTKPTSPALVSGNPLAAPASLSRVVTFTEGSGSTLHDYSGNSGTNLTTRQVTTTTSLTWSTDSTYGRYVHFNGSNQDAIGADTGLQTGVSDRTFAFLFRTTGAGPYAMGGYGTSAAGYMGFFLNPTGFSESTATQGVVATTNQNDGNWHIGHAVVSGGVGTTTGPTVTIYVDGVFNTTTAYTVGSGPNTVLSGNLYLGQGGGTGWTGPGGSIGYYWPGDIAGFWEWNSALSATQIASHYNSPWQMVGGPQPVGNTFASVQAGNWSDTTVTGPWGVGLTAYPWQKQAIAGIAASPTGAIRITLSGPSYGPNPGWASGYLAYVENVVGTTEANAPGGTIVSKRWAVNVVDPTHLDLKLAGTTTYGTGTSAITGSSMTRASDLYATTVKGMFTDGSNGVMATVTGTTGGTQGAWAAGQRVTLAGVSTDYNGTWIVNSVGTANGGADATLVLASVFTNAYTSGGTISRDDGITINNNVLADVSVQGGNDVNAAVGGITINSGATLTIKSGTTLTSRVGGGLNGGTLALQGGSAFLLGASLNGPVSFGPSTTGTGSLIKTTTDGTAPGPNNRATFGVPAYPASTPNNSWFQSNYQDFVRWNLAYANVTGGTADAVNHPMIGRDNRLSWSSSLIFDHINFNACGQIGRCATNDPTGTYSFTNCTWTNSVAEPLFWGGSAAAPTTGIWLIQHCYFDLAPLLSGGAFGGTTITDSVFAGCWDLPVGSMPTYDAASFARNLVVKSSGGFLGYIPPCSMTDTYHLVTALEGNTLFCSVPTSQVFGLTMLRNTFESPFQPFASGNTGDCFYTYNSSAAITHTVQNCLILPVATGQASETPPYAGKGQTSGALFSGAVLTGAKIQLIHNTVCDTTYGTNGQRHGPYLNEGASGTATSAADSIHVHRDNLFWDPTNSGNYGYTSMTAQTGYLGPDNCLNPANCKNNAYFGQTRVGASDSNLAGKTSLGTYYYTFTTGTTPGANDVTLSSSPNFVDPTRNFLTWGRTQVLGLTGRTDAQAPADIAATLGALALMNADSGSNAGATVAALNTWVRAGWAPRNVAIKNKASDGTTPGAIAGQFIAPIIPFIDSILRRHRVQAAPPVLERPDVMPVNRRRPLARKAS